MRRAEGPHGDFVDCEEIETIEHLNGTTTTRFTIFPGVENGTATGTYCNAYYAVDGVKDYFGFTGGSCATDEEFTGFPDHLTDEGLKLICSIRDDFADGEGSFEQGSDRIYVRFD